MNEALRGEAPQKTLNDSMFQMQMDNIAVHGAGIFEDDRTNRRITPPLPRLLIRTPGRAQGVHRIRPGWVGAHPLGEVREFIAF